MMKQRLKNPGFWISIAGTIIISIIFCLWYRDNEKYSILEKISAVASATLFTLVCLRFVPEWMEFWGRKKVEDDIRDDGVIGAEEAIVIGTEEVTGIGTEEAVGYGTVNPTDFSVARNYKAATDFSIEGDVEPGRMGFRLFAVLLLWCGGIVVLVYFLRQIFGYTGTFEEELGFWRCADSRHYLDIARDWYLSEGEWDRLVQLVFLPGYPLAIRLVNLIVNNYLYSGMIVSACSFAGAGCVIYRLLRLDYSHKDAIRTIRFLCLLPGAFFFVAPMSESLFLLLCVSCIYLARKDKWLLGCLCGALAAFTRSLGLTLCVPLFFELVSEAVRTWKNGEAKTHIRHLGIRMVEWMFIPAGFGAYCVINYLVSGNFFQFMKYQSVHWNQNLGWFFNTAAYQMKYAFRGWGSDWITFLGLWLPNLLAGFLSLVIMIPATKKLRASYTAWFLVYYLIAMGATWLLSAPRYMVVLLPIPLAMAFQAKRSVGNALLTGASALLSFLYLCAFVLRWKVW